MLEPLRLSYDAQGNKIELRYDTARTYAHGTNSRLHHVLRFVQTHNTGGMIPHIEGHEVVFQIEWYNATTQESGFETYRVKTTKEAMDALGY